MRFLTKIAVNGVAIWIASIFVHGIHMSDPSSSTSSEIMTVLVVGLIFGIVNALVRPVAKLIGLPFLVLSLGLFIFLINGFMLVLTSGLSGSLGLKFHVDHFWPTAVVGSLVVSIVSWVLSLILDRDND